MSDNEYGSEFNVWDETINSNEEYNYSQIIIEEQKEIPKYIVEKIIKYYNYNKELCNLIKSKYSIDNEFFGEYFPINANWINNFLQFYHYDKILQIIQRKFKGNLKEGNKDELYETIKEYGICVMPGDNDIIKNNLKSNFFPGVVNIPREIYKEYISEKTIYYSNNFILVKKELFNLIRQDNDNNYTTRNYYFDSKGDDKDKIKICLVDNIFIYRISDNILGFGIISESSLNNQIPIFNLLFLIIITEESELYNSDTELEEIFKIKDLKKYLVNLRRVKLDEDNDSDILDIYAGYKKIGFFYNIGNFNLEMYLNRNDSSIKDNSPLKRIKELEKENETIIMKYENLKKEYEKLKKEYDKIKKVIEEIENEKEEIKEKEEEIQKREEKYEKLNECINEYKIKIEDANKQIEKEKNILKEKKEVFEKEKKEFKKEKEEFEKEKVEFKKEKEEKELKLLKLQEKDESQINLNNIEINYDEFQNKNKANLRYSENEEPKEEIFDNNLSQQINNKVIQKKNIKNNYISINSNQKDKCFRPLTSSISCQYSSIYNITDNNPDLINKQNRNILNYKSEEFALQNEVMNYIKKKNNIKIYRNNNKIYIKTKNGNTFQLNLEIKKNEKKNNYYKSPKNSKGKFYSNVIKFENPQEILKKYNEKKIKELNFIIKKENQNLENFAKKQIEKQNMKMQEIISQNIYHNNVLIIGRKTQEINNEFKKNKLKVRQANQNLRNIILSYNRNIQNNDFK